VNLEAAVRDLKAEADDSKRKLRLATENQVAAEDERDAAQVCVCVRVCVRVRFRVLHALALSDGDTDTCTQGEARELASRVTELEEAGHAAGEAVVEELQSAKAQLAVAGASYCLIKSIS
jgi:hypothetical protein